MKHVRLLALFTCIFSSMMGESETDTPKVVQRGMLQLNVLLANKISHALDLCRDRMVNLQQQNINEIDHKVQERNDNLLKVTQGYCIDLCDALRLSIEGQSSKAETLYSITTDRFKQEQSNTQQKYMHNAMGTV